MKDLHKIIKGHWKKQKVKFVEQEGRIRWVKTLRSVDCAVCKKHAVERREDEGFDNWRIMPEIINPQGLAPEICPECAKKFNLPFKPARKVRCKRCGIVQKEKIFGIGFPGWIIPAHDQRKAVLEGFCPQCYVDFIAPSMPEFIHSTWYDLTFPSGSLLTSTKMTQLDGNFDALAAQEEGAPTLVVGQTQLKTATGSVSASGDTHLTLPGGQYAFFPQTKTSNSGSEYHTYTTYITYELKSTTYATRIYVDKIIASWSNTFYALTRYLQSSPPYEIEHFIYLLTDESGKVIAGWEAPDPPWYGQGIDGKATEEDFPYPFLDKEEGQKIILVNPNVELIAELSDSRKRFKKGFLEFIHEGNFVIGDEIHGPRGLMTEKIIAKGVEFRPLAKGKPIKMRIKKLRMKND